MAKCITCDAALGGSWKVVGGDGIPIKQDGKIMRYQGVNKGYFLSPSSGSPDYLECFCINCYKHQVTQLASKYHSEFAAVVTKSEQQLNQRKAEATELLKQKEQLTSHITSLTQQKAKLQSEIQTLTQSNKQISEENRTLQQQQIEITTKVTSLEECKTNLATQTSTLQQQHEKFTAEITTLEQQKNQFTSDISSLKQQKTQLETEVTPLSNETSSLQEQVQELKEQIKELIGTSGVTQLRKFIYGLSENEVKILKDNNFDCASFPTQVKETLKNAAQKLVQSCCQFLLHTFDQMNAQIHKDIANNEQALKNMESTLRVARTPESVIEKAQEEVRRHVAGLHEQLEKWSAHKRTIHAINY